MNAPREEFENWDEIDEQLSPADRVAAMVAGDLDPADQAEVEALIENDPELQAERDYWRSVQASLPEASKPSQVPIPGPGLAAVLKRRLQAENLMPAPVAQVRKSSPKVVPMSAAIGWAVAAAACVALAILVIPWGQNDRNGLMIYDEAGVAQVIHSADSSPSSWHTVSRINTTVPEIAMVPADQNQLRPWIGLWTKPIDLEDFDRAHGLLGGAGCLRQSRSRCRASPRRCSARSRR